MAWQWFHQWGSPRWFYQRSGAWLPWLSLSAALLLLVGSVWGLALAPADFKQGNSYRIIYWHVPASFLALAGYYLMAIAGAIGLIWKIKLAYTAMRCAATIGAALTFVALFTGAVWGKPTWGTYWVWDARITSMLVLLFLYLGVIALYQAFDRQEIGGKAAALLGLVGTVNVPIIYKSVDWWYTLHQPASLKLTGDSTLHSSMLYPLLVMVVGFYFFYAVALLLSMRAEVIARESNSGWVKALVAADANPEADR